MVVNDCFGQLSLPDEFWSEALPIGDNQVSENNNHPALDSDCLALESLCRTQSSSQESVASTDSSSSSSNVDTSFRSIPLRSTFSTSTTIRPKIPSAQSTSTITSYPAFYQRRLRANATSSFDVSDSDVSSSPTDDIFSPSSTISSVSSVSDEILLPSSGQSQPANALRESSSQNFGLGIQIPTGSGVNQSQAQACSQAIQSNCANRRHPRRTSPSPTWTKPSLVHQNQRRELLVEHLIDSATQLVACIWPQAQGPSSVHNRINSLHFFIRETLRRSRTSYSTFQVTLWYLVLIRPAVIRAFAQSRAASQGQAGNCPKTSFRALKCGRRMFLAALILASKYLQDRNFTARAWNKITGLPTSDIVSNEFGFLAQIDWRLHFEEQKFLRWSRIVLRCTESSRFGRSARDTWSQILCLMDRGSCLNQVASFLELQRTCPMSPVGCQLPIRSCHSAPSDSFKAPALPRQPSFHGSTAYNNESRIEAAQPTRRVDVTQPPTPSLDGRLQTPQLPPASALSAMSTPAAGLNAFVCDGRLTPAPSRDRTELQPGASGNWDSLRTEFPMDLVRTPSPLGSGESNVPAKVPEIVRNKAFGLMTPSSSVDSAPLGANASFRASGVLSQSPTSQQATRAPSVHVTPSSSQESLKCASSSRETSQDFDPAAVWINMLAKAADEIGTTSGNKTKARVPGTPLTSSDPQRRPCMQRSLSVYRGMQLQKTCLGSSKPFGEFQKCMRAVRTQQHSGRRCEVASTTDPLTSLPQFDERQLSVAPKLQQQPWPDQGTRPPKFTTDAYDITPFNWKRNVSGPMCGEKRAAAANTTHTAANRCPRSTKVRCMGLGGF